MKITCLGAGKSGFAAAKLALKNNNEVFLSEYGSIDKFLGILDELNNTEIEYEFGNHSIKKILESDLVVCSPGIKPDSFVIQEIKKHNIKLISEIEFASYYTDNPTIAITGTNGKTTTVNLIHYILTKCGKQSELLGNVGNPYSDYAINPNKESILSLELSSYQLDNIIDFRPDVAAFLNITEDHISYHGSFQHYFEA